MKLCTPADVPALVDAFLAGAKRPLIVVLGPTASGKTAFSVSLAHSLNPNAGIPPAAEIVNADSRQLYQDLSIGTAKVTEVEKEGIQHHLFDVLPPTKEVTIAWYKEQASVVIDDILVRNHVPILVGGSMLYISALIDGLEPLPPVDRAVRERLEAAYDVDKGRAMYAKLQKVDPETAAAFHRNNRPYLVRAMAMYDATGIPPSAQKKRFECPYDLLLLGMYWDRKTLTSRIEKRTPLLLEAGWIEEVQALRAKGYDHHTPAFKSHGYREVLEAIEKAEAEGKAVESLVKDEALIDVINSKTRQYAKRQMTWWKHDERINWIKCG